MATALLVTADTALRQRLSALLAGAIRVVPADPAPEALATALDEIEPRLVLLDHERREERRRPLETVLAEIRARRPGQPVIVIGDAQASTDILDAIRAGASDFLDRDIPGEELRARIANQLKAAASSDPRHSSTIMLLSGRPNDGESLIALHLAASRALRQGDGGETVLVDFNLPISECEIAFNTPVTYTVTEAVNDLARLDRTLLLSALARHSETGLYLLPLTVSPKPLSLPPTAALLSLLEVLRASFASVVINLGCLRHADMLVNLLPMASTLVVVTSQSLSALRCCSDVLKQFRGGGATPGATVLAIADHHEAIEPGIDEIRAVLDIDRAFRIPADRAVTLQCLNEGVLPITRHPHSAHARAIEALLAEFYPELPRARRAASASAGLHRLVRPLIGWAR